MSRVLTIVAGGFFLVGLATTIGYVVNQALTMQQLRQWNVTHPEIFVTGVSLAAVGMITLALLEIRKALLLEPPPETPPAAPAGQAPASARASWRQAKDLRRSYLDIRD